MSIAFRGHADVAIERLREIEARVASHERLTTALRDWAARSPPGRPVLQVAQDEFSHDVVIQIDPALHLAYEVT